MATSRARKKIERFMGATSRLRNFVPASYAHLGNQSPARNLYWTSVRGTTERRPILTSGESAKSFPDLISANVTGLGSGFPALISTLGFLGSEASTEATEAVPTALLWSPVS